MSGPYRSQDFVLSTQQERLEELIRTLEWSSSGSNNRAIYTTYRTVLLTIICFGSTDYRLLITSDSTDSVRISCKTTILEEIFCSTRQREIQERDQEIRCKKEEVFRLLGID